MFTKLILALAFVAGVFAGAPILKCKDQTLPVPVKLEVSNCDNGVRCTFYRGENAQANITFNVPFDAEEMNVHILATVPGLLTPVKYPLKDNSVCPHLTDGYCPVQEGETVTYQVQVPVLKVFPKIRVEFEMSIVDEDEETATCFNLPIEIKDR